MAIFSRRVPLPTKIFLLDHLRVMLKSGVSIGRALESLGTDVEKASTTAILTAVRTAVEHGSSLADATAAHPELFPTIATALIRAGEQSGSLEDALAEVSGHLRKEYELRTRVQSALLYPTIVVGAMLLIGIGVVTFILPRIVMIFKDVPVLLPLPTRILLAFTAFTQTYGIILGIGIIALVIMLILLARSAIGRPVWHRILLRLPFKLGYVGRSVNLSRCLRTLAGLLRTDIPIVQALELTGATLGNFHYQDAIIDAAKRVGRGERLAKILAEHRDLFPPTVVQVVSVGEETGSLDRVLAELSEFYGAEADRLLQNLTTIIEPILILAIGAAVAYFAVAIILPMQTIAQAF